MNAYKLATTLKQDGTILLEGLPFHAGDMVEIIILEQAKEKEPAPSSHRLLAGTVLRYDDPFDPAVPAEDWEALK